MRLERAVELDRVDVRDALGEVAREDAEAGADLEHDVVRAEVGETADHAEDVLVDEEVLAELLLRRDPHSPNAAVALASIWRGELGLVLAARLGERGERVHDVGRLVGLARGRAAARGTGCRSRRGGGRAGTRRAASRSSGAFG